jgi:hypothetical protein
MANGVRKALYCLLMIAVPLQAFASVGMQQCVSMQMPLSQSIRTSASLADQAAGSPLLVAQTDVSTAIGDCDAPAQDKQTSERSADHCAASAGCGIVAASVPALPYVMQVPPNGIPAVAPPDPSVGFMTGAPERPPRTIA